MSLLWIWPLACAVPLFARMFMGPLGRDLAGLGADPFRGVGILQAVLWSVTEAGMFTIAVLGASSIKVSITARKLSFLSIAILTILYVSMVSLMWTIDLRYQSMPQLHNFALVEYLFEKVTLSIYLSFRDMAVGASFVVLITAVVSYEIVKLARLESANAKIKLVVTALVMALSINFLIGAVVKAFCDVDKRKDYTLYMANNTLPQGAILGWLLYHRELQTFEPKKLNLEPYVPYAVPGIAPVPRNVLIVAVEAMRYDAFSPSGKPAGPLVTLNRLAEEGVSFRRAYAQAPDTEYSLNTILSGLYPLKYPYRAPGGNDVFPTLDLPQLFGRMGYRTAYLALFDWTGMRSGATARKFDLYSDPTADGGGEEIERRLLEERKAAGGLSLVDRQEAISRLDTENVRRFTSWVDLKPEQPFFALFYLYNSHFPFNVPQDEYRATPTEESTYYFPPERSEYYKERYLKALVYMDQQLANILDGLEKVGILDQTLIIVTGDHGEEFYEHGGFLHVGALHEETLHVPLVYWGLPAHCRPDLRALTGHIDIAPTLLEALKLPPYPGYQGLSLCRGESGGRALFASSQGITDEDAIYWQNYKFVRNYRGQGSRFFDLLRDPKELVNLLPVEHDRNVSGRLRKRLQSFRDEQLTYYDLPSEAQRASFPPAASDLN